MITYKVTPAFKSDWENLYLLLFGANQHCASMTEDSIAKFSFEDDAVTPADLGPLVKVEVIASIDD